MKTFNHFFFQNASEKSSNLSNRELTYNSAIYIQLYKTVGELSNRCVEMGWRFRKLLSDFWKLLSNFYLQDKRPLPAENSFIDTRGTRQFLRRTDKQFRTQIVEEFWRSEKWESIVK